MQFMIWDFEGNPIQAVITALRERLDGWDCYCVEEIQRTLPGYPKYRGTLFRRETQEELIKRYEFRFEVNVAEEVAAVIVDRV